MNLSARAKGLVAIVALVGLAAFLLVVEFGVNAGRIHHGVSVGRVSLGGLTVEEAGEHLAAEAEKLAGAGIELSAPGFHDLVVPKDLGWSGRIVEHVRAAHAVGRDGSVGHALRERLRSWFEGVRLRWRGRFQRCLLKDHFDRWEYELSQLDLGLNRYRLTLKLWRAAVRWPRREVRVPVKPLSDDEIVPAPEGTHCGAKVTAQAGP